MLRANNDGCTEKGDVAMRVIVVGYGVQGPKRRAYAGDDFVGIVDPFHADANWARVEDVPLESYDAALVCTPDAPKVEILSYLLGRGKHVLVEKPLIAGSSEELKKLAALSRDNGAACYTAYNHRFEPHFIAVRDLIAQQDLGEIYRCRMFYGNGTARLVRNSEWRDEGAGVLPDLASHLLDTIVYWFGEQSIPFRVLSADRFENRSFDHVVIGAGGGRPTFELEMTLLSWRNYFSCDIFAEKGSAHIESLSKWGGSKFTVRTRKLPSGRPDERQEFYSTDPLDKTWELEYAHFKHLCESGENTIQKDIWLNDLLASLSNEALERYPVL
jgi:scyllo-inositol 2-dehydrogenase (NADP+)